MIQPTKKIITKKILEIINGNLTREEVADWAFYYIENDDKIPIVDYEAWHYLVSVSSISEIIKPNEYLYSNEDLKNMIKEYS